MRFGEGAEAETERESLTVTCFPVLMGIYREIDTFSTWFGGAWSPKWLITRGFSKQFPANAIREFLAAEQGISNPITAYAESISGNGPG
jgi:hypothetical protein